MEWTPEKIGYDKLVQKYGQTRADLLVQFLRMQMDGLVVPLGPIVREIVAQGGMFGWTDQLELAFHLSTSIAHVRGQTFGSSPTEPLKDCIESLSLLSLPRHHVTTLPQDRMPTWEMSNGASKP